MFDQLVIFSVIGNFIQFILFLLSMRKYYSDLNIKDKKIGNLTENLSKLNAEISLLESKNSPENIKKNKENKDLSILEDLMSNDRVLIEIRRIAPSQFFIRSPRDME